ncbi:MAG: hypothetical protein M1561_00100 [Gammaproteobacteria bacterium]|nr:hypothetical protein [Gammaproteobacteria bacterium]
MKKLSWIFLFLISIFIFDTAYANAYNFTKYVINSTGAESHQVDVWDAKIVTDVANCPNGNACIFVAARYENSTLEGTRFYATQVNELYNATVNWTACNLLNNATPPPIASRLSINLDSNDTHVYSPTVNTTIRMNFSTCASQSNFTLDNTTGHDIAFFDAGVNEPTRPDKFYIKRENITGGTNDTLYISTNSSGSYSWVPVQPEVNLTMNDISGVTTPTTNNSRFYLATNSGIFKCDNSIHNCSFSDTVNWTNVSNLTNITNIYATYLSDDVVFAARKTDGLYVSFNGGSTWVTHYNNSTVANWSGDFITGIDVEGTKVYISSFQSNLTKNSNFLENFEKTIKDCKHSNKYLLNSISKGGVSVGSISGSNISWTTYLNNGSNFFGNGVLGIHVVGNNLTIASYGATCNTGGLVIGTPIVSIEPESTTNANSHLMTKPILITNNLLDNINITNFSVTLDSALVKNCNPGAGCYYNSTCTNMTLNSSASCYVYIEANQSTGLTYNNTSNATVTFNYNTTGSGTILSANKTLKVHYDNSLYLGGYFTQVNDSAENCLVRWTGTAGVIGGWAFDFHTEITNASSSPALVRTLALYQGDLVAGGDFKVNTTTSVANNISRWNGATWFDVGNGTDNIVWTLAVNGTELFVGGTFSNVIQTDGKGLLVNYTAKWDGTSWSALGSGTDGSVYKLLFAGDSLYAGGAFNSPAANISRWNSTSGWSTIGASGANKPVYSLAFNGTDLYAGGTFTSISGVNVTRIAKWDGAAWSNFSSNDIGVGGAGVRAIAFNGTDMYVGGGFIAAGGVTASSLAKWNGTSWDNLSGGINSGFVFSFVKDGTDMYVGGQFTAVGGVTAYNISILNTSTYGWSNLSNSGTGPNNYVSSTLIAPSITITE